MTEKFLSMADVVRESHVARHRIVHALISGAIREPFKLNGRRLFRSGDLKRVIAHFAKEEKR